MDFTSFSGALLYLVLYLGLCAGVGAMARQFKRSSFSWFVLSLIFTPVAGFVFLLVADVPHDKVAEYESEQKQSLLERSRDPGASEIVAANEMNCPNCGNAVNPITREGLDSPEKEAWRLLRKQCGAEIQVSP